MPGMIPLYGTAASRALDARATELLDGDGYVLMQRAGQAAWQHLLQRWPQARRIVVACGPGNNGGDGYVLARLARVSRCDVRVVHLREHVPCTPLAQRACTDYLAVGGQVELFGETNLESDVIVDALFGIGLSRAPDGNSAALIDAINTQAKPVFSLDVPSGLDADSGFAPGRAIAAGATLQFIAPHVGLRTGDALELVGEIELDDLDVPGESFAGIAPSAALLSQRVLKNWLRPRRKNTHKGESGRVLCIGGEHGHGGAIVLCAEAALRAGTGLLTVATREKHVSVLLSRRPEAMAVAVESNADLQALLPSADVIALGPGLGRSEWGRAMFNDALAANKPLVLDADALNILSEQPRALNDAILTPHPGEAARLLGISVSQVQRDRFAAAKAIAGKFDAVVVLKGAGTIVAAPGGASDQSMPRVLGAGNPGMAVGGMGDLLTGVLASLRGQGMSAFDAASTGALLHSLAGDLAAKEGERGLLPSDLLPHVRALANP